MSRYRWVVLASGTLAQASYSAIWFGVSVLAPQLRARYSLTLAQAGLLIASSLAGSIVSLVPWGLLADRLGERRVIGVGLGTCGIGLMGAARASGFASLALLLILTGMAGASVNSASGRAVMHWFGPEERGFALGIRQTAVPLGGFAASLALPRAGGVGAGFVILGGSCLATALLAVVLIREAPRHAEGLEHAIPTRPLRDRRIWRIAAGSALMLAPQMCVVGFTVLFLHEQRGLSPVSAAYVLAAVQVVGIAARIAAGRWSDRAGSRVVPLRRIALVSALLVAVVVVLVGAPLVLLVPALVVAGGLGMSWNGLSFTAAAELAGRARSGAAIGLQQTVLSVAASAMPGAFGALVGATSWRLGFSVAALAPLAGFLVLRPLRER
jgi:sugar phosphate permease